MGQQNEQGVPFIHPSPVGTIISFEIAVVENRLILPGEDR